MINQAGDLHFGQGEPAFAQAGRFQKAQQPLPSLGPPQLEVSIGRGVHSQGRWALKEGRGRSALRGGLSQEGGEGKQDWGSRGPAL